MFVMYENMVKVSVGVMLISDITKQIEILHWDGLTVFAYYLSPSAAYPSPEGIIYNYLSF